MSGDQHLAADALLDRVMPVYDVVEHHSIRVLAPYTDVFRTACELDLKRSRAIRAIFRLRELMLGATSAGPARPLRLVEDMQALGWRMLAEIPGREIVMGTVTRPWVANVRFLSIPPDDFARFQEPNYVKIAWTLRADTEGDSATLFQTETRAWATDSGARARFRIYWFLFRPGIVLIRKAALRLLREECESTG